MQVRNIIADVSDGRSKTRSIEAIDTIAVHRCGKNRKYGHDLGDTAMEICDAFCGRVEKWAQVAQAVGYQDPYTFIIGGNCGASEWDGVVWQCLDLLEVGPHAKRWNTRALGVAVIADPRFEAPSEKQRASLVALLAVLARALDLDPFRAIRGHDELIGGTSDPNKECPGKLLPMNPLRSDVADTIQRGRQQALEDAGIACSR